MPGSVVSKVYEPFFDITKQGNVLVLPANEGTVGTYQVRVVYGDWAAAASLSLKQSAYVNGADPKALGTPVTITSDATGFSVNVDTTGASSLVLTVDTPGTTANSVASVQITVKGDRIQPLVPVFGANFPSVIFDSNPGGGSAFP